MAPAGCLSDHKPRSSRHRIRETFHGSLKCFHRAQETLLLHSPRRQSFNFQRHSLDLQRRNRRALATWHMLDVLSSSSVSNIEGVPAGTTTVQATKSHTAIIASLLRLSSTSSGVLITTCHAVTDFQWSQSRSFPPTMSYLSIQQTQSDMAEAQQSQPQNTKEHNHHTTVT